MRSVGERPVRLGFLYPGHDADDDYPTMARQLRPSPAVQVVHTSVGEDAHRIGALVDLGDAARLAEAAARLDAADVAVWACTSGSFVFGWEGAKKQVAALAEVSGLPWSSTTFAFVEAARALGVERVAVAATYPPDVTEAFESFLADAGISVVASSAEDIITAAHVGTLDVNRVVRFVSAGDHPDADAVLVPDTALHSAAVVAPLEAMLGKPVLTANLVTMWEALRLSRSLASMRADPALGMLFVAA